MPFTRRPDSWIYLSGSPARRQRTDTAAKDDDESLSEFASETNHQVKAAPDAAIAARVGTNDDTAPAKRIQNSNIHLQSSTPPTRSHTSERPRAQTSERPRARSTEVIRIPLWTRRVRDLRRRIARSTTLTSFAGGAAAGVVLMWFVAAQSPSPVMPLTTHAVTAEATLRPVDHSISPPNVQLAAEGVPATPQLVGTSGRSTGDLNQTVRPSAVASSPSARTRKAAVPPRASYRGSLAFRSAPQGARVFVNGAFVGSTPLVLENLPVGSRAVRIEADGYQRWSASTQVVANQQTRVSATLGRARQ
jgi:hypothetical protein